jgi:hypothetical protein
MKRALLLAQTALVAGLALLAPGAARADTTYKIQPIVKQGDEIKLGDVAVKIGALRVGTLNDAGQVVFGAPEGPLLQYAEGNLTPIAVGGGTAPGGQWSKSLDLDHVVSMNQRGNVVFAAAVKVGATSGRGTFLWDAQTKQVTAVAVPGMPAVNSLTFATGLSSIPAINNHDEIALGGTVKDTTGPARPGLFFRGRDGKLLPVLLPDQELPGGGTIVSGGSLTVTDAGVVGFGAEVRRAGETVHARNAYLWEQGTLSPVAVVGQDAPGGGKIARITAVRVNNQNRAVLLAARLTDPPTQTGLYRFAEGQLTPVAVPGQDLRGGGKLQSVVEGSATAGPTASWDLSRATEAGQIAFLAKLDGGGHGVYRVEADGKLALILKEGDTTELGAITRIPEGSGIGLNSKGQVALAVKIADSPLTLVLLIPIVP